MTETPAAPRAPRVSRRAIVLIVIAVAAVTLAVGVPTWGWRASVARGQVDVVPIDHGLICGDDRLVATRYRISSSSPEDPYAGFVTTMHNRTTCELSVILVNRSSHAVNIRSFTLPVALAGKSSGFVWQAESTNFADKPQAGGPYGQDATFRVDERIGAGESSGPFEFFIRARPLRSCDPSTGVQLTFDNIPEAHISALGWRGTIHSPIRVRITDKRTPPMRCSQ